MLTLPVTGSLEGARSVLLAGCGGGYDVMGAVPLIVGLQRAGKRVHLASLSFTYLNGLDGARQVEGLPNLYEVRAANATSEAYCPEAWLARFLEGRLGGEWPVWCLDKTGVKPLLRAYKHLVAALGVDAIVLLDGGIDALLRGDETSLGTPAEDLATLAAVRRIDVPRVLACVGMGAEIRDGICHEQALARVAELTRLGGFRGGGTAGAGHGRRRPLPRLHRVRVRAPAGAAAEPCAPGHPGGDAGRAWRDGAARVAESVAALRVVL